MQNLIVFCQRCFTWVEPFSDFCPECGVEVELDRPDLELNDLAERLGRELVVLGLVRVERHGLPSYGHLIGTTEGVVFLPRLHRRMNGAWEGVNSQRLPGWWPFRGDAASPRFLNWLRKPFAAREDVGGKIEPVAASGSVSLAQRLMDSPGAFFVERRATRLLTVRRRTVRFERPPLRSVTVVDETEDGSLVASLNALVARTLRDELNPARSLSDDLT